MTVTISPHYGPGKFADRSAMNITRVSATGAETAYLDLTSLIRLGMVNMGVQIQAVGASVTPAFTMEHPDAVASNPGAAPWDAKTAITAGAIQVYPQGGTFLRLVFAGAGSALVGAL